jgi:hypothetical protein
VLVGVRTRGAAGHVGEVDDVTEARIQIGRAKPSETLPNLRRRYRPSFLD